MSWLQKKNVTQEKYSCKDCGQEVVGERICASCILARPLCNQTGCTIRVPKNKKFPFCKIHKCSEWNCLEPRVLLFDRFRSKCETHLQCKHCKNQVVDNDDDDFCSDCKLKWDRICVGCSRRNGRKAKLSEPGKLLCESCSNLLPTCGECKKNKVYFSYKDSTFQTYNYCDSCFCFVQSCTNTHGKNENYCTSCIDKFGKCGKIGFKGPCQWLKDSKEDKQCSICCRMDKCTRPRHQGSDYCPRCFHADGKICELCFNYADAGETFCNTCKQKKAAQATQAVQDVTEKIAKTQVVTGTTLSLTTQTSVVNTEPAIAIDVSTSSPVITNDAPPTPTSPPPDQTITPSTPPQITGNTKEKKQDPIGKSGSLGSGTLSTTDVHPLLSTFRTSVMATTIEPQMPNDVLRFLETPKQQSENPKILTLNLENQPVKTIEIRQLPNTDKKRLDIYFCDGIITSIVILP